MSIAQQKLQCYFWYDATKCDNNPELISTYTWKGRTFYELEYRVVSKV